MAVNIETGEQSIESEAPDLINKSVIKATVLLTELGLHPQGITVTELAKCVRMSRPTAFRLLLSLEQTGFVERADNKYKLGWRLARLGRLADPHAGIISRVQPILKALAEELNEMIGYAVVNGDVDFDLIAEASGSRLITLSPGYVARDFPLHASATGKIILAEMTDEKISSVLPETLPLLASRTITDRAALIRSLHKVRKQRYAVVDDELEESLFALAVGVRDERDRLIGVLAVTGPTQRMHTRSLPEVAERLHETAKRIVAKLL
ncbi:IclR family transcriptional regulator [Burkholderia sp. USMB20]|uniref:IclR family transcriptional regulator n=1 Tax=Burkholderia sp. USMB20 TaxID=1571773 RepID=UPI00069815EC|nr:IclR family transcriptional regulator [Burkholderia sp. USMB20]TGN99179.1 IclR family transcriptional regulator [Burkholderia sp. USMB20]